MYSLPRHQGERCGNEQGRRDARSRRHFPRGAPFPLEPRV
jgi:hypothetical protein